jgi:hypothetical protein
MSKKTGSASDLGLLFRPCRNEQRGAQAEPRPLAPFLPAEGTPRLGLVALNRPGLAPGRRFDLRGQLLWAAGRDKGPFTADRDPHAFQRIEQDAPPGEPGPEPAGVVSGMGTVVWHGIPPTC